MESNLSSALRPDAISLLGEAFSCPRWARYLDVRPFTRLPVQRHGRPKHDLVDALRGHLFYKSSLEAAGSEANLIRHATVAWDLDPETVKKQIRSYARGEVCPSKEKQLRLANAIPSIKNFVKWPWEALYFRRFKQEPAGFDQWRNAHLENGADVFWSRLIAFRDAIDGASADLQIQSAQKIIYALPAFLENPSIRGRKVEMLDLVLRLFHALPAFLMPDSYRLRLSIDDLLTEAEKRALLTFDEHDWHDDRIVLRHLAFVVSQGTQKSECLALRRRLWDFMPSIENQNTQFDDIAFLGMFPDDDFDALKVRHRTQGE